ncbi:hypothetical protein JCM9279_004381 [Rhodotorula babjevae]
MASQLLDELLALILDQVAADRQHLDTRRGAKEGLVSACLASKRMRRLAQKVLWRQVEVRSPAQVDRVRRGAVLSGLGGSVVVYRVLPARRLAGPFAVEKALEASRFLPHVEEVDLSFTDTETLRLGLLTSFTKLRRLSLASCNIIRSMAVSFDTLEHIRLEDCGLPGSPGLPWLQHADFPALRVVDLVDFVDNELSHRETLDNLFSAAMLDQLDYVYVQAVPLAASAGADLALRAPPVFLYLWDPDCDRLPAFSLFLTPSIDGRISPQASLDRATTWLGSTTYTWTVSTPTLVLSTWLRRLAAERPAVAVALASFEAQCTAKGVRLVWTEARGSLAERFVLPEVQQLARELRAPGAQV